MASDQIREDVLRFLAGRPVKHDESVEYGWFILRTVVGDDGRVDVETLDFRAMASFTRDFTAVERIDAEQSAVLARQRVEPGRCALWHAALVSRSYAPGAPRAFLDRPDDLEANESGWYVGVADDPLDVNDPANLHFRSLYELSIHDPRFTPYWLLPAGFLVEFDGTRAVVTDRRKAARIGGALAWLRGLMRGRNRDS